MIQVYTSYFYQIRNMTPNCLAFSTACGDPIWFHEYDQQYFIDKNGVLNGLRAEPFVPRLSLSVEDRCTGPKDCSHQPPHCPFLLEYEKKLDTLNPKEMEYRFKDVGRRWQEFTQQKMDITYILLVHEAPSNPCSERVVLQRWLKKNKMGGAEWTKQVLSE